MIEKLLEEILAELRAINAGAAHAKVPYVTTEAPAAEDKPVKKAVVKKAVAPEPEPEVEADLAGEETPAITVKDVIAATTTAVAKHGREPVLKALASFKVSKASELPEKDWAAYIKAVS